MEQKIGSRIAANRKRLKLTQEQLAEKLGVTPQAVSKWENDQSCPDIWMLPRLAELFGATTDALLGVEREKVYEAQVVDENASPSGEDTGEQCLSVELPSSRRGKLLLAIWMLLAALMLAAANILEREVSLWTALWSTGVLAYGLAGVFTAFSVLRLGCTVFGGYFILSTLELFSLDPEKNWLLPLMLLVLGCSLLVEGIRHKGKHFHVTHNGKEVNKSSFRAEDGQFSAGVVFGEMERTVCLERLAGGKAEVSFGEMELDLSGCGRIAENCVIDVSCVFGELTLKVPEGVAVRSDIASSFGSVEMDKSGQPEGAGSICLAGSVNYGSVNIEYIA